MIVSLEINNHEYELYKQLADGLGTTVEQLMVDNLCCPTIVERVAVLGSFLKHNDKVAEILETGGVS